MINESSGMVNEGSFASNERSGKRNERYGKRNEGSGSGNEASRSRLARCGLYFFKSQLSELNRRPAHYEGAALPAELSWPEYLCESKLKIKKANLEAV